MNVASMQKIARKSIRSVLFNRKLCFPAISAHSSQYASLCLRWKYNKMILSRSFHKSRDPNPQEEGSSTLGKGESEWQESDVAKQVRESIEKQKEADASTWEADKQFGNDVKKSKDELSSDNSFFGRLSKWMSEEEGVASKTVKEDLTENLKREEEVVEQADQTLASLEENLTKDAYPAFMRPFIRNTVEQLKSARSKADKRVEQLKKELEELNKADAEGVVAKEGSAAAKEGAEATAKETEAAKGSTAAKEGAEATAKEGSEAGKEGSKGSEKESFWKIGGEASKGSKGSGETDMGDYVEKVKKWVVSGDIMLYLLLFSLILPSLMGNKGQADSITYDVFIKEFLLKGNVGNIKINENGRVSVNPRATFTDSNGRSYEAQKAYTFYVPDASAFMLDIDQIQYELGIDRSEYVPINYKTSTMNSGFISMLTSIVMLYFIFSIFLSRKGGGGMNNFMNRAMGIESNKVEVVKNTGVTFKDVAGIDEAKQEIMEFIDFLKNGEKYSALGAKIPKGAILMGPPGTGKTLLVKAAAGEASVPFLSMSGSDFVELFVGMGARRVRELFAEARKNAPCIVFIDEIDAIGKKRNEGKFTGSDDEREQTLNQILIEMDGFKPRDGITVFAGTNRVDVLDPALLRAGRFDRHISVDKPDLRGRKEIAVIYLKKVKIDGDVEEMAQKLAEMTPGYTGADINNIINEAAIIAIRNEHDKIMLTDLISAVDRVLCGMEKKNSLMTPEEKRRIAYHEAGHALIGWLSEHVDPMLKVTIVPRSNGALGFTQNLPKEIPLYSQEEMSEMLVQLMGGRAAEKIFCGGMTTGASDDLSKATKLAYGMVAGYGFSDSVGPVNYQQTEEGFQKPYSEATGQDIDNEARAVLKESMNKALEMLEANRDKMVEVAELLLARETITSVDMENICGKRRGRSPTNYSQIIRDVHMTVEEKKKEQEEQEEKEKENEQKEQKEQKEQGDEKKEE